MGHTILQGRGQSLEWAGRDEGLLQGVVKCGHSQNTDAPRGVGDKDWDQDAGESAWAPVGMFWDVRVGGQGTVEARALQRQMSSGRGLVWA